VSLRCSAASTECSRAGLEAKKKRPRTEVRDRSINSCSRLPSAVRSNGSYGLKPPTLGNAWLKKQSPAPLVTPQ
jgi:hypothetical protein